LQALIKGLVSRGAETVFLEVQPSNQVAVNLYQSMGFECIQKRRDYYPGVDGVREDAWVFSLACL
jgi:ribosomal-protein-alanine N-acetyltransferase